MLTAGVEFTCSLVLAQTSGWAPLTGQVSREREKSEQGAYSPSFSCPQAGYAPLLPATAFEKVALSVQLSQVLAGSAPSLALSSLGW